MKNTKTFTTDAPPSLEFLKRLESFRLINKDKKLSISIQYDNGKNRWRAYKTINGYKRQLSMGSHFNFISKNELALESAIRLLNDPERWNARKTTNNVEFWQNGVIELLKRNKNTQLDIPEELESAIAMAQFN